ncbi:MAG: nucleotide exchange factor GrpE [Myxococcales bacterium]|nr:nucleotide exchange factor GrpE [Myxococcales bacterium]
MTQTPGDENAATDVTEDPTADERSAEAEESAPTMEEIVAELDQELTATKDKWLRAVAELENYKKRVKRDIDDAVFRARKSLLADLLPTVDNLERALSLANDNADLAKGIRMVSGEFIKALARHGIEPVPSVGHAFDPAVHEALQQMPSDKYAPGIVTIEYEKGFRFGDRLLRAARVIVASPDSTGSEGVSAEPAN